jgi:hypothetical protein
MLVEEALDQPPVPPLALCEHGGGPAPAAAEEGCATWILAALGALASAPGPGAVAGARLPWPVHIFLIFRYRRTSGSDRTTNSARAALAAAMATAVMYPSARIACLLFSSGPCQRPGPQGTGSQPDRRQCERQWPQRS